MNSSVFNGDIRLPFYFDLEQSVWSNSDWKCHFKIKLVSWYPSQWLFEKVNGRGQHWCDALKFLFSKRITFLFLFQIVYMEKNRVPVVGPLVNLTSNPLTFSQILFAFHHFRLPLWHRAFKAINLMPESNANNLSWTITRYGFSTVHGS